MSLSGTTPIIVKIEEGGVWFYSSLYSHTKITYNIKYPNFRLLYTYKTLLKILAQE